MASSVFFDTIHACDRRTDGHRTTAFIALRRAVKARTQQLVVLYVGHVYTWMSVSDSRVNMNVETLSEITSAAVTKDSRFTVQTDINASVSEIWRALCNDGRCLSVCLLHASTYNSRK